MAETSTTPEAKSSWPELVGKEGKTAAAIIEKENPLVHAIVVKVGTAVTDDLRTDRVRVWVDDCGIVAETPKIG
ncbi:unnamed protein product [Spirodela intermedia]|uniref:Uncharacterized protein n=2 Tax=Spirodela intermedia TaxID=51605 RepID=A0A7I8KC10_SPIIN|nr:unnamed protein product [Spirodela intermedia]CAA6658955.1 unnamed protein product [Spirodela intermedia]CAA7395241.1 unnamed protein product [Spirodela intermedia]